MQPKQVRLEYLDLMRGTLMMLGVVLHSAQIYNPAQAWLIHANSNHAVFSYLVQLIASFRMPAFFVVSGFFCMMLIKKASFTGFIATRTQRIAVPLLVTALSLNIIQFYFLGNFFATDHNSSSLYSYFSDGVWVQHLWFLINLLVYIYMLAVASYVAKFTTVFARAVKYIERVNIHLLLWLMPFIFIVMLLSSRVGLPVYESYFGFFHVHTLLYYMSFFFFGVLIFSSKTTFDKVILIHPAISVLVIMAAILCKNTVAVDSKVVGNFISLYTSLLISWYMISLCFVAFKAMVKKSRPWIRFVSDSSYTVYLLHHLLVIVFGTIAIYFSLGAWLGFLFVVVPSCVVAMAFHHYIVARLSVVRLLLNGKP